MAAIVASNSFRSRLIACAAEQEKDEPYPGWVDERIWRIAASPGWAEKWDSAIAGNIADPGRDTGVISDADIRAAIQPMD